MKKKYFFISIVLCLLINSQCSREKYDTAESYYSNIEINNKSNIMIDKLHLDSIVVDSIYVGYLRVFDDTIYFVEFQTCRIFPIDVSGNVYNYHLGQGRGPKEYPSRIIYDFNKTNNGNHIVMGMSWDYYIYDKQWEIIETHLIDWQNEHSREYMLHNPKPDMPGLYSFHYAIERDRGRVKGDYIYYEISSQHPTFNMINSRDYYRKGRIIAKLNYKTGVVEELIGLRSLVYENYEYIGHLSFCTYDVDIQNNKFYLGFQPDSLIYVCDKNFVPVRAFGRKGRNMNVDYTEYSGRNFATIEGIFEREIADCGYYESIEYIEERSLLFRSYTRGSHDDYDGLQIYHNEILVADIDVPKGFKVMGYIEPYFISNIFLDYSEIKGVFYKFKLNI